MTIPEHFTQLIEKIKKPERLVPLIFPVVVVILLIVLAQKGPLREFVDGLAGGKYFLKQVMDQHQSFWILLLNVIVIAVLSFKKRKSLWEFFKSYTPSRSTIIVLTSLAVICTWFTGTYIVERHRVQSDESIYLAAAQNMYHNQSAGACKEGYFDAKGDMDCKTTVTNFKAKGLALLYMLPMKLFGEDLEWIFKLQLVFYFLMFFATFYGINSWTNNEVLSLFSTAMLGLTPTLMFQFRSSSVEPLYVLLSLTALFLMKWAFEHSKDYWDWALFAAFLGLFAQTRQETVFCFLAFGIFSLPLLLDNKKSFHAFTTFLTFFSIPILITISIYQGYSFQGGEHSAHGHFWENLWINLKLMVNTPMKGDLLDNPFLSYQTVLSIAGFVTFCIAAFKNSSYRKWLLFLALYHIQSFMIFENVSGDFTININQRYILIVLPTMAFFAGFFIYQVLAVWLKKFIGGGDEKVSVKKNIGFTLLVLAVLFSLTYRHKPSFEKNIMYKRNHLTTEQVELRGWIAENEGRKLFIYGRPYHMLGYGHSSMHYRNFKALGSVKQKELMKSFGGEVYYVRGLDCWNSKSFHKKAVETRIEAVCDGFEQSYDLQEVFRSKVVRSYPLYISKLHGKRVMQIERDLTLSDIKVTDTALSVNLSLKKIGKTADFDIIFNGQKVQSIKPKKGDTPLTIPLKEKIVGFYTLEVLAFNSEGRDLGRVTKDGFIDDPTVKPLTQLSAVKSIQSWSKAQVDKSLDGNVLKIGGREFTSGYGVHAFSTQDFKLDGKYKSFIAGYGLDDEDPGGDGVRFLIYGDGKELFKSSVVKNFTYNSLFIDVSNVQVLSLQVDSLTDKHYDHADWIQPFLIKQ
ncbi:MAG: NPCBM/NEW2 domain-containing protein [Fibrobacterales bacterium]